MQTIKKETGENVVVNLDPKNYKLFLDKFKELSHHYESKSNHKNLKYAMVLSGRKQPFMNVKGWASRVIDKNQRISEVIFADYDDILYRLMETELKYVMQEYNLSPFYIFTTQEAVDQNGEVYGNYLAVSITKKSFRETAEIIGELRCDPSYKVVPKSYKYKTWVLRLSNKGKKKAPVFKCVIGDTKKSYNQDCSQAHLEVISKVYKIPKIKYTNLDGNHQIYLSEYKTASS